MFSLLRDAETVKDTNFLSVAAACDYRVFARQCSSFYDTSRLLEMAVDGDRLFIFECKGYFRNSNMDAYMGVLARRWMLLIRLFLHVFLNVLELGMLFANHATYIKFTGRTREVFRFECLFTRYMDNLSRCCLPRLFS